MSYLIIIPLLNKKVSIFPDIPLSLGGDVFIDKLADEEHSAFFRGAGDEYKSTLDINETLCIKWFINQADYESTKLLKTKVTFSLNVFSEHPIITTWAGILNEDTKLNLKDIIDFEALAGLNKISSNEFKIYDEVELIAVSELYRVINEAVNKDSSIAFTLERFNSSLLRTEFADRVIDATICFETLIPGNTELTYKLSLYIAFITANKASEREQIFEDMKKLYDVRSKIVHGDLKGNIIKKIKEVEGQWGNYKKILKSAVTYYLIFLAQKGKNQWEDHLKKLVLGTEAKII